MWEPRAWRKLKDGVLFKKGMRSILSTRTKMGKGGLEKEAGRWKGRGKRFFKKGKKNQGVQYDVHVPGCEAAVLGNRPTREDFNHMATMRLLIIK